MVDSTSFHVTSLHDGAPGDQVPDDFEEFDWIQISETPC